jgi:Na+/glutamate symporter
MSTAQPSAGKLASARLGLMQLVGQCFCIGPLIDVALFLGIVASLAGAIGPLAVLLASFGVTGGFCTSGSFRPQCF